MGTKLSSRDAALSHQLLTWYDRYRRKLPWRAELGKTVDPYRVWLSEIMLQQTTVTTVIPYFGAFLCRWPTVKDLAKASIDDVLHAWQGLGYYARAHNLHACAKAVSEDMGGRFPDNEEALRSLPGIGTYTAAAIAAIAFGRRCAPVDGNIARVMARLHTLQEPLPQVRQTAGDHAFRLTPNDRPGDFVQAMMDLGATVCKPRNPACDICPWHQACQARRNGTSNAYPIAAAKRERPLRHGIVFWTERSDQSILVRRRPEKGLLGGMAEFPSTTWGPAQVTEKVACSAAPCLAQWRPLPGVVAHGFTHFRLELTVWRGRASDNEAPPGHRWCPVSQLGALALPTLMRKVAQHVEPLCL
ncbi:MAG: A/G-specific adenine glycosylase [Rhodospirillales bacterium]|jgi:A/G-specific adenine glycosylase